MRVWAFMLSSQHWARKSSLLRILLGGPGTLGQQAAILPVQNCHRVLLPWKVWVFHTSLSLIFGQFVLVSSLGVHCP